MEKRRPCRGQPKIRDRKRDSVRGISNEIGIGNEVSMSNGTRIGKEYFVCDSVTKHELKKEWGQ